MGDELEPDYSMPRSSGHYRLSQATARDIINALRRGTVPQTGLEYLAVGLDREVQTISAQLQHVATGRGDFKFVRGAYRRGQDLPERVGRRGGAQPELRRQLRRRLHRHPACTSWRRSIIASSPICARAARAKAPSRRWSIGGSTASRRKSSSWTDMRRTTRSWPIGLRRRWKAGWRRWQHIHSAFSAAIRGYYRAQVAGDYATAQALLGWLSGEQQISARSSAR